LFSAGRAREELRAIAGDGRPRPVGSAAASDAREKIVQQLKALGYQPEVQDGFACSAVNTCAHVRNVTAIKPGAQGTDGPLVMLSAHYDSVPAGPGASDDAVSSAAILEIARALSREPPAKNAVLFLINEGEEPGLIGAEAFTADHPLAKRVAAVVNVEARGTTGPSLMFETSAGNGPLISLYAEHVPHPETNSIYYTVYKTLPNDTDLTVYKRVGYAGINFAFIGGEVRYHTPKDDVAHADPASLQHQGQNALAMVRALAAADLSAVRGDDAVFFDVFTLFTIRFPERWMPALGGVALALVLLGAALVVRRGHARADQLRWGLLAALSTVAATALLAGATLGVLMLARAVPYPLFALPAPAKVAFWVSALAVAIPMSGAFLGRAGRGGLWLSSFLLFGLVGGAAAVFVPGLSYPAVVPALVAGVLAVAWGLAPSRPADQVPRWVWLPPFVAASLVWLPLLWLLYDGLGAPALVGVAVAFSLVLTTAATVWGPVADTRTLRMGAWLVWAAAVAAQLAAPRFTEDHSRKLNLEYQLVEGDRGPTAKWTATGWEDRLAEPLASSGHFADDVSQTYPWPSFRQSHAAPAPALPLSPPTFDVDRAVVENGHLKIEGRLASPRGALYAGMVMEDKRLVSYTVNGKAPPKQVSKNLVPKLLAGEGWVNLMDCTTGTEGARYTLEFSGAEPMPVYLWDQTFGLPEQGATLAAARPPNTVPFQVGNVATAIRPIRLEAK
jgi:peptidase M28-like protein